MEVAIVNEATDEPAKIGDIHPVFTHTEGLFQEVKLMGFELGKELRLRAFIDTGALIEILLHEELT